MNTRPIPARLFEDFCAALDAVNDDDLPDGAWWQMLEDAADEFMRKHRIGGCRNAATHRWVAARGRRNAK